MSEKTPTIGNRGYTNKACLRRLQSRTKRDLVGIALEFYSEGNAPNWDAPELK